MRAIKIILISLFSFLFLGCNSKKSENQSHSVVKENPEFILNQNFKNSLAQLISIREYSLINERGHSKLLYLSAGTTKEHLYLRLSNMNCETPESFFSFTERIGDTSIGFLLNVESIEPERFFDLRQAKQIKDELEYGICDDWYYLLAKYKILNGDLILERTSGFLDETIENGFYAKEDLEYLIQSGYIFDPEEPEPEPVSETE